MMVYGLMDKNTFEKEEDNPFRVIDLLVLLGKELKISKPMIMYPQIEMKIGKSYLYVTWGKYGEYRYSAKVCSIKSEYTSMYGYSALLEEYLQFGSSIEFYEWLSRNYKDF